MMQKLDRSFLANLEIGDAGFLDNVEVIGAKAVIHGWAVCQAERPLSRPARIFALADETLVTEITDFSIARPDVCAALNDESILQCGFSFTVDAALVENGTIGRIECFAESQTGKLYQISKTNRLGHNLQVEVTGRCNYRCVQCPSSIYSGFNNIDLDTSDLALIAPLMRQSTGICFDGFGETLIAKHFDDFIRAVPWTKHLLFHTNGTHLMKKAEILLDHAPPLRRVIVSLDSLKPDLYAKIRKGGELDQIMSNIRGFLELKKRRRQKFPRLVPNLTVMRQNYQELPQFVELAAKMDGFLEMTYLYDSPKLEAKVDGPRDFRYGDQAPRKFADDLWRVQQEAEALARKLGVTMYYDGSAPESTHEGAEDQGYVGRKRPLHECPRAGSDYTIQADGKFMYCVWQTSAVFDWRKFGSVDFSKNERARQVAEMISRDEIPHECSGAHCLFVARALSKEPPPVQKLGKKGGWQM